MVVLNGRKTSALVAVCVMIAGLVGASSAAAVPPHVEGWDEAKLRRFEERVLGPGHAAEHARGRKKHGKPHGLAVEPTPAAHVASAAALDPSRDGRWTAPFELPVAAIHAALLPTGKVLMFAYPNRNFNASSNRSEAYVWDPVTNTTRQVDPPRALDPEDGKVKPVNLWCAGQSLLADGRVLVTGGNLEYFKYGANDYKGLNRAYVFNPFNESWTEQPAMRHGRWYPSQVLLPDGRTAIMGGYDETGGGASSPNLDIELFTPSADLDGRGRMELLGFRNGGGNPPNGGFYPHMFGLPSGRALVAGPEPWDSWLLHDPGAETVFGWSDVPDLPTWRRLAPAVNVPGGANGSSRVMLLGGLTEAWPSSVGTNTTTVFDEADPSAGWRSESPQQIARAHHNVVITPDGGMVSVGGGLGEPAEGALWAWNLDQRTTELWDPATKRWRLGAGQQIARTYHSTAMLLPDGRILSAGDDVNGPNKPTAELYEPPYLHRGPRPTITSAPGAVAWNTTFKVGTTDTDIARAVLIAPSATTHATDMSQRYVPLAGLTRRSDGTGYDVRAPASGTVAAPGYHMLFLLNDRGVPSVARWVRIGTGRTASDPNPPPPPSGGDKALNRPATASSRETPTLQPGDANDGDSTTRFSTEYRDGEWWQVDLGSARQVDRVRINWEAAYAARYRISTSTDGITFTTAAEVSLDRLEDRTTTFAARAARFVRITGVQRATEWGMSFWDVEVYGPDDTGPLPPPPDDPDKALDRTASASSVEGPSLAPRNANDGSSTTRWSSAYRDGEWWQVDLGRARLVDRVRVNWEDAYAATYRISTSTDGTTFATAAEVALTRPEDRATTFGARSARYVRITGLRRATPWGISFWDVNVRGPADP